jgi:hypothetical protein
MITLRGVEKLKAEGTKMADFWDGRDPCWVVNECPEYIREKCPAFHEQERSCWEVAYTHCEFLTSIAKDCKYCKVYNRYHQSIKD